MSSDVVLGGAAARPPSEYHFPSNSRCTSLLCCPSIENPVVECKKLKACQRNSRFSTKAQRSLNISWVRCEDFSHLLQYLFGLQERRFAHWPHFFLALFAFEMLLGLDPSPRAEWGLHLIGPRGSFLERKGHISIPDGSLDRKIFICFGGVW